MSNDIQPMWKNFVRRVQAEACKQANGGCAIINISVVVDGTGTPLLYTEPKMTKLEPQSKVREFLAEMINNLVT